MVQPRKIRPCLTETLLMGRKESEQNIKQIRATLCLRYILSFALKVDLTCIHCFWHLSLIANHLDYGD